MVQALDLRPGKVCNFDRTSDNPADLLLLRAYLATFPGSLFGSLADSAATMMGSTADVLLVADAFEHVLCLPGSGEEPDDRYAMRPSESPVFRSLAEAIAQQDPSLFQPGTSNLDWRTWATFDDSAVIG
jgi:hypothetical protein